MNKNLTLIFVCTVCTFGLFSCEKSPDISYDWKDVSLNANISLEAISMIDENVGYVGGRSYADIKEIHTNLGNGTFGDTLIFQPENGWFYHKYDFEDSLDIEPCLYKTQDGGKNWQAVTTPFKLGIRDMQFITEDAGYVVTEQEGVYKTSDGGQTWSKLLENLMHYHFGCTYSDPLKSVSFIDEENGFVYGNFNSGNVVFSTRDGGESWHCLSLEYPPGVTGKHPTLFNNLKKLIFFPNSDTGYAVDNSVLYKTSDMGENWKIIPDINPEYASSVYFANPKTGYLIGHKLFTMDGGMTWSSFDLDFYGDDVVLTDQKEFFYLADGAIFRISMDNPDRYLMTMETDTHIKKIVFPSDDIGYAIGSKSTILKYVKK